MEAHFNEQAKSPTSISDVPNKCLSRYYFLQGDYYPALASYKSAKVKFNFGPKFRFPPKGYKVIIIIISIIITGTFII